MEVFDSATETHLQGQVVSVWTKPLTDSKAKLETQVLVRYDGCGGEWVDLEGGRLRVVEYLPSTAPRPGQHRHRVVPLMPGQYIKSQVIPLDAIKSQAARVERPSMSLASTGRTRSTDIIKIDVMIANSRSWCAIRAAR